MDLPPGYRELAPPPELGDALACLWIRVIPPAGSPTRVLPDGCSDLIWQVGRGAFVAGPDTEPVSTAAPPGAVMVGARFLPGAGGATLGVPLGTLQNLRVDVTELRPELGDRLPAELRPQAALHRLAATVRRLTAADPPDPAVRAAARLLADPRARVEMLADELGLSDRQLRRRFHTAVGYGPKTLQRVLRFRRFLAELDVALDAARSEPDLARIAVEVGYADQAHLTRECADLGGLPPAALARTRGP